MNRQKIRLESLKTKRKRMNRQKNRLESHKTKRKRMNRQKIRPESLKTKRKRVNRQKICHRKPKIGQSASESSMIPAESNWGMISVLQSS